MLLVCEAPALCIRVHSLWTVYVHTLIHTSTHTYSIHIYILRPIYIHIRIYKTYTFVQIQKDRQTDIERGSRLLKTLPFHHSIRHVQPYHFCTYTRLSTGLSACRTPNTVGPSYLLTNPLPPRSYEFPAKSWDFPTIQAKYLAILVLQILFKDRLNSLFFFFLEWLGGSKHPGISRSVGSSVIFCLWLPMVFTAQLAVVGGGFPRVYRVLSVKEGGEIGVWQLGCGSKAAVCWPDEWMEKGQPMSSFTFPDSIVRVSC